MARVKVSPRSFPLGKDLFTIHFVICFYREKESEEWQACTIVHFESNVELKGTKEKSAKIKIENNENQVKLELYWIGEEDCWKDDDGKGKGYQLEVEKK